MDIAITLNGEAERKLITIEPPAGGSTKQKPEQCPLYFDGEPVRGRVEVRVRDGRKLEHTGVKCEFIGQIELYYDRGQHNEFLSMRQELAAPGELRHTSTYEFEFRNVEK